MIMKTYSNWIIAAAAAVGTGLLIAQAPEKKPDPAPGPGAAPAQPSENALPFQPPARRDDANGPRDGRPPRQDGPQANGERRPNNPNNPDRPFRRFDGEGERPFRPDGVPGERPLRPEGPDDRQFRPNNPPDGDRPPQGGRPVNQNVPLKPQPFLGVVTRNAPGELSVQLKQPEGFGLIVDDVLDDGPAKAAGIRQNDLLRMLDDQMLVNPPQLEALVRRAGKDKEIALTILREGSEQKITVKIGEKMLPVRRPLFAAGGVPDQFREPFQPRDSGQPGRDGNRNFNGNNNGNDFRGQPQGAPLDRQTRYATERARVVRRDDSGVYELQRINGRRILSATRPDGTVIWKGAVETEEERKAMPDEVRKKFDEIESSRPLDRIGDRPQRQPFPGGDNAPPRDRQPNRRDGGSENRPADGPPPADAPQ